MKILYHEQRAIYHVFETQAHTVPFITKFSLSAICPSYERPMLVFAPSQKLPDVIKSKQISASASGDQDQCLPPNSYDSPTRKAGDSAPDDMRGGNNNGAEDQCGARVDENGGEESGGGQSFGNNGLGRDDGERNDDSKNPESDSLGEKGRIEHDNPSLVGGNLMNGDLMMNKTSERLAAAATRIAESAAAANMKELSRDASRSNSIGGGAGGYLSGDESSCRSSKPTFFLPPQQSSAGFIPTSNSNSPLQPDNNNTNTNTGAMVVAVKPTVSVRQEIERKQAAARLGATYEAEKLAEARAVWTFRPNSSYQDQDAMGAALKKLNPLISTKVHVLLLFLHVFPAIQKFFSTPLNAMVHSYRHVCNHSQSSNRKYTLS